MVWPGKGTGLLWRRLATYRLSRGTEPEVSKNAFRPVGQFRVPLTGTQLILVSTLLTIRYSTEFRGMTVTFSIPTRLPLMIIVAFHPIRAYAILYLEQRCEINQ